MCLSFWPPVAVFISDLVTLAVGSSFDVCSCNSWSKWTAPPRVSVSLLPALPVHRESWPARWPGWAAVQVRWRYMRGCSCGKTPLCATRRWGGTPRWGWDGDCASSGCGWWGAFCPHQPTTTMPTLSSVGGVPHPWTAGGAGDTHTVVPPWWCH